jgi:hypothetical protein
MKPVVVAVDAVVNVNAVHPHVAGLDDADGMKCARHQREVTNPQILAAMAAEKRAALS